MLTSCESGSVGRQEDRLDTEIRSSPSCVISADKALTQHFQKRCTLGSSARGEGKGGDVLCGVLKRDNSLGSTADITFSTTTMSAKKDLISSVLDVVDRVEGTSGDYRDRQDDDEEEEDDESVRSIERILCPRAASFGSTNKRRGGRWDTNLMEDSMPGLVSFCHGSFASESNFNASLVEDNDNSVSSLECSLLNSQHSKHPSNHTSSSYGIPSQPQNNVLEPQARVESSGNHQEFRWGKGPLHQSSDTLPMFSRRQGGGRNLD